MSNDTRGAPAAVPTHQEAEQAPAVPADWRKAVQEAYGWLWHVNNEPMAPVPLWSPEQAAYEARKNLRGLLTTAERGEAINSVAGLLSNKAAASSPAPAVQPFGFVKPDNERQVFFYEQDFYVLSNFSAFTLMWKGNLYDTSEAAYHSEKFAERDLRTRIMLAPSAHEAFKLAEGWRDRRRKDWDDVKVGIMREILRAKAAQHEYVRRKLLATGDRELIEDSWRDDFWGWGPNRDGKNMLGKLWMQIRAELRDQPQGGSNAE